jgi:hypothetical protein
VGPGADGVPLLSCMDLGSAGAAEQQLRSQAIAKARRLVLRLFGAACLRRSCLCTTCGPAACVALPVGRGRAPESGREALACA